MDISSRYYTVLKERKGTIIRHLWGFLSSIYRVGKLRELCSFCYWELKHRLRLYQNTRYLHFTGFACLLLEDLTKASAFQFVDGRCFEPLSVDWRFCVEDSTGTIWGCRFSNLAALYCSTDPSICPTLVYEFPAEIASLFMNRNGTLFIACQGVIYKSTEKGSSFEAVLQLSSSISYFLFNNGMTELPNQVLLLGEYGSIWNKTNWQNLAFLYYSTDGGSTWAKTDFLQRNGVNKHIHIVRYSSFLKAILLTDGDNKKQLWLNSTATDFEQRALGRKNG